MLQRILCKCGSRLRFITLWLTWICLVTSARGRHVSSPTKFILSRDGDIFDCIDIYEQPTLKDPLFKDHKVQMFPSGFDPSHLSDEDKQRLKLAQMGSKDGECPEGTVPILRLPEALRSGAQPSLISPTQATFKPKNDDSDNKYWALRRANNNAYYGAWSQITVYGLNVGANQMSLNLAWLIKDNVPNPPVNMAVISSGWGVAPFFFGDSRTRFITYWNANGTNCYNNRCSGFVQVSKQTGPGAPVSAVSTIHGQLHVLTVYLFKDFETGHWWLSLNNINNVIGYWPKELFGAIGGLDNFNRVDYGGFVACPSDESCPPMGSGVHPHDDWHGSSFIQHIRVLRDKDAWWDVHDFEQTAVVTAPHCYDVATYDWGVREDPGFRFHYGGNSDGKQC